MAPKGEKPGAREAAFIFTAPRPTLVCVCVFSCAVFMKQKVFFEKYVVNAPRAAVILSIGCQQPVIPVPQCLQLDPRIAWHTRTY